MKEKQPIAKQAAFLCLASPFIASLVHYLTRSSGSGAALSGNIVLFVTLFILAIGTASGLYSLSQVRRVKGVVLPASIGLVFHALIGYVAYSNLVHLRAQHAFFLVQSLMQNDSVSYEQIILGRVHGNAPVEQYIESVASSIQSTGSGCKVLRTERYNTLPDQFAGIYENRQLPLTYVSIDSKDNASGDLRFLFPSLNPQPSCKDLAAFINQKKSLAGTNAKVSCSESANQAL